MNFGNCLISVETSLFDEFSSLHCMMPIKKFIIFYIFAFNGSEWLSVFNCEGEDTPEEIEERRNAAGRPDRQRRRQHPRRTF